jgi:amino acid transporter
MFTRRATGLVREVGPFSTFVFNVSISPTAIFVATGIFGALALFSGANLYLALVMSLGFALIFAIAFGLLSTAIPRSGGDYVFVGRVFHPALGLVSSYTWVIAILLSVAFFAVGFSTVVLAPSFDVLALVSHSSTLASWGNTLATDKVAQFLIGTGVVLVSCATLGSGWGFATRYIRYLWFVSIAGIAVALIVMLTQGHSGAVHNYNEVLAPTTGHANSYAYLLATAHKQGINLNPGFSFSATIPAFAMVMAYTIYTWCSMFIAGEVRRARSLRHVGLMALPAVVNVGIALIAVAVFYGTIGREFLIAANSLAGTPAYPIGSTSYAVVATVAGNSSVLGWFLALTLAVAFPLVILTNTATVVRPIFAWAFDGVIPMRVAKVGKNHQPRTAVLAVTIVAEAVLVFAVWGGNSFLGVLGESVLFAMTAMLLLSLAAIMLPYRRPEAWQASVTTRRLAGIPMLSLFGVLSTVCGVVFYYMYLHYSALGVHPGRYFRDLGIIVVIALVNYFGARAIASRKGIDVEKLASEIPPE